MRKFGQTVIALTVAGLSLAGCGLFTPNPPSLHVEFESTPSGAEARTSMGQSCTTPCAVSVPVSLSDFTVSFTLADFQPVTIPVRVTGSPAGVLSPGTTNIEPNPVVAQLQPIAPPPKPAPVRPKNRKQAQAQ
jgi:hypothetical protein